MTSFFVWNMRGFNMSRKHREVKKWVMAEKFSFGCVLETRVQHDKYGDCMAAALPGWASLANYDYHRLGRIWFCWSDKAVVTKLHMSSQVITCAVQIPETREQFICSAVYASNCEVERRLLWEELRGTRAAYEYIDMPWIVIGDFNVTLTTGEHSRGTIPRSQIGMQQFQDVVRDCEITDLAYNGAFLLGGTIRMEIPLVRNLIEQWSIQHGLEVFPRHMLALRQVVFRTMLAVWYASQQI